jgi:DNA processing protein
MADGGPAACAAALASLPGMSPHRLAALFERWPDPEEAWAAVSAGRALGDLPAGPAGGGRRQALGARWRQAAAGPCDPATVWRRCRAAGIEVAYRGGPSYPEALAADHEAPAVLFWKGDLTALDGPRVAVVGTRRCTATGAAVARDLGEGLAAAGVRVVSGLALGIDGAAHDGALRVAGGAPPVGVVGSGLDVPYPRRHRGLWQRVATHGVLLGEAPPGAAPEPWRFPARNRILAALAAVVVVVESHLRGGSKLTVDAALARDVPVMAVPGSVRSPASAGTNELLAAGAAPARDVDDVLVALALAGAHRRPLPAPTAATPPAAPVPPRPQATPGRRGAGDGGEAGGARPGGPAAPSCASGADAGRGDGPATAREGPDAWPGDPVARAVLGALAGEPATLERLALRTGLPPGQVSVALTRLACDGVVAEVRGWWERVR